MSPDLDSSSLTSPLQPLEDDSKMGVDEMLRRYAGEFGPWQLRHFVLVSLAWALGAFHTMVMIFADREPAWHCIDSVACHEIRDVCGLERNLWEWDETAGSSTVVEWGLVCGERYKVGLVRSAFFAGCMISCGIFGHLSDSFLGRKGSLITLCIINTISSCLTALSPTYPAYLVLRALTGLSIGAMGPCAFVLATEPIGPSKRAIAGMSVFYFFSIGIVALSALAYVIPSWRTLYIACSIPTFLFLVTVIPFVSESPRWYLIRGNAGKAMEVMRSIAKRNGRHLPANISLVLDDGNGNFEQTSERESVSDSILDVVRSRVTRVRLAVLVLINFLCSLVYYGITLNIDNLSTNTYLGTTLNAVAEMPAFALTALLMGRLGRRPLAVGTMWLSAGFCVVGSLVENVAAVRMGCGVMGIFGMAATFNLLLVYASELFPTAVRNAALGCVQQAAHIGSITAPMVVMTGGGAALGVFGACGVVGGVLAMYLPETWNKQLYDTMAGMEDGEKAMGGDLRVTGNFL